LIFFEEDLAVMVDCAFKRFLVRSLILFPDKLFLSLRYFLIFHRRIDWNNPVRYTEKLQWVKLYLHNPRYTNLADKVGVRDYVARKIGLQYLVPLLGVWESFKDIDTKQLPNAFVLKCNHDSGSILICRDKSTFDFKAAERHFNRRMKTNFFWAGREWPYKNIPRKIFAEEYLNEGSGKSLIDYKFFCFDGVPKLLEVISDRGLPGEEMRCDFFDLNFNHMNIHIDFPDGCRWASQKIEKPDNFNKMIEFSKTLSRGIPHVRVDFYNIQGHVYFGELTFFQDSGFVGFIPKQWNVQLGEWFSLPTHEATKEFGSTLDALSSRYRLYRP
jgi:hypothetical protein